MIEILPIGTKVIIGGSIQATIIGISIREQNNLTYEVMWWNEGNRKTEWLWPIEIEASPDKMYVVGFKILKDEQ